MKNNQNTLCLDMDGVVADWVAGAAEIIGYRLDDPHQRYPSTDWALLRAQDRLFRALPKMQSADRLVEIARQYRDQLGWELVFLTAIPHNNDMPWTFWDKFCWAQEHYPDIPVWFGPYSEDKRLRVRVAGDILVDDRADNCAAWTRAGGLAFKVAQRSDAVSEVCDKLLLDFNSRLNK